MPSFGGYVPIFIPQLSLRLEAQCINDILKTRIAWFVFNWELGEVTLVLCKESYKLVFIDLCQVACLEFQPLGIDNRDIITLSLCKCQRFNIDIFMRPRRTRHLLKVYRVRELILLLLRKNHINKTENRQLG